jgi:lipid-binding SYLF domain-containing protein
MFIRRSAAAAALVFALLTASAFTPAAHAQTEYDTRLAKAAEVFAAVTSDEQNSIPIELLARAHGIAVIPNVIRGGFILGGRRGRGVLTVRMPNGQWSNPAFITVTGGSIGWQFGAESTDIILVFANERSVRNIAAGKFTLGGDASAVAGPLGRQSTAAVTFKAEVYAYVRSRGLFAGAAFEGAKLDVDEQGGARYYARSMARTLREQNAGTSESVRQFLRTLEGAEQAANAPATPATQPLRRTEEAVTFPLGGAP